MTDRNKLLELAREAGFVMIRHGAGAMATGLEELERFAALLAAQTSAQPAPQVPPVTDDQIKKMFRENCVRQRMQKPAAPVSEQDREAEIELNIIRKWPDGFQARLEHVWKDLIGFIPSYKLYDLQRMLAEYGFTMKIYEVAARSQEKNK